MCTVFQIIHVINKSVYPLLSIVIIVIVIHVINKSGSFQLIIHDIGLV